MLVNKGEYFKYHLLLPFGSFVSHHKNVGRNCHLSWGHDREKGMENVAGISILPFCMEFQYFGGKTLHYLIVIMSLCYITNDIISLY